MPLPSRGRSFGRARATSWTPLRRPRLTALHLQRWHERGRLQVVAMHSLLRQGPDNGLLPGQRQHHRWHHQGGGTRVAQWVRRTILRSQVALQ